MRAIPIRYLNSVQKEPNLSESFNIREVKDLLAGTDMIQELHRHDFFYVLALTKGAGSHEIDFLPYKVCDNSVFFMRPGQVHQLSLRAGSKGYLMQFKSDFYFPNDKVSHQVLRKASHKNLCQLDAPRFKKLVTILKYIFQEYTDKLEGYLDVVRATLGIFFIELVRHRQNKKSYSTNISPYSQERLDEFLELLEIHISTQKQVSQYADMLNLSVYQLNAITKSALGKTPSDLINEFIILESKRNLIATSNQVNQIAYSLGYEDVSYFIRFFKKHTGHSPEAFRHNFK
jgi:AraC family transcriptional regulator, transcriptional activator of pobA